MKSYVYTRSEKNRSHGGGVHHMHYTLKLYQIKRGTPVLIGTDTDMFCSDWQQCRDLMKKLKVWPKAAEELDAHGRPKYHYAGELRAAGIVNVNHI